MILIEHVLQGLCYDLLFLASAPVAGYRFFLRLYGAEYFGSVILLAFTVILRFHLEAQERAFGANEVEREGAPLSAE